MTGLVVWKNLSGCCVCSHMHLSICVHPCLPPSLTPDYIEKCPSSFSHGQSNPEPAGAVGILGEGCWLPAEPCGVILTGLGVVIVGCMLGPWSWFTEERGTMVPILVSHLAQPPSWLAP